MEFNATFIVATISFIVFVLIMNKILYRPVSTVVEMRENLINGNYNAAKLSQNKATQIYTDRDEKLNRNAAENKKLTNEKVAEANLKAKEKTTEAKLNSIEQINSAKVNLQQQSEKLNNELQGRIDEFADNISAKILGEI